MFDVGAHVYAHRGLWNGDVPENSLAAFRAARAAGLGVELDVRASADGEAVVFHDATLQRLCGDPRRVDEAALPDLAGLHLPDGSAIPTLDQAIGALAGQPVLVEIKIDPEPHRTDLHRSLVQRVASDIPQTPGRLAAMSFDESSVRMLADLLPGRPVGQLIEPLSEAGIDAACAKAARALDAGATYLAPHLSVLAAISAAFENIPLVTWTVRTNEDLALARRCGAGPIFELIKPPLAISGKATI